MHRVFLSEGAIHVLVLSVTKKGDGGDTYLDEKRVRFWLDSIRSSSPRSNILIIGTHSDLLKGDEKQREAAIEAWKDRIVKLLTIEILLAPSASPKPADQREMIEVISCAENSTKERKRVRDKLLNLPPRDSMPLFYVLVLDILNHLAEGALVLQLHVIDVPSTC